jgi:hypothetical protein
LTERAWSDASRIKWPLNSPNEYERRLMCGASG